MPFRAFRAWPRLCSQESPLKALPWHHSGCTHLPSYSLIRALTAALGVRLVVVHISGPISQMGTHAQAQREEGRHPSSSNKLVAVLRPKYELAVPSWHSLLWSLHSSHNGLLDAYCLSMPSSLLSQGLCTHHSFAWQAPSPDLCRNISFLLTRHHLKAASSPSVTFSPYTIISLLYNISCAHFVFLCCLSLH